jgi:hypothetical protein
MMGEVIGRARPRLRSALTGWFHEQFDRSNRGTQRPTTADMTEPLYGFKPAPQTDLEPEPARVPDVAPRRNWKPDTLPFDRTVPAMIEYAQQHPGRLEGGQEAMLRPVTPAPEPTIGARIAHHALDAKRGELDAAAHAARVGAATARMLHAAGQHDRAVEGARAAADEATRHLAAIGNVAEIHDDGVARALSDAWACASQLEHTLAAIARTDEDRAHGTALHRQLEHVGAPHGWKRPEGAAIAQIAASEARREAGALHLPITAPIEEAALHLEAAVAEIAHAMVVFGPLDIDAHRQLAFERAAHVATALIARAEQAQSNARLPNDHAEVRRVLTAYRVVAQRFVQRATPPAAATIMRISAFLLSRVGIAPLVPPLPLSQEAGGTEDIEKLRGIKLAELRMPTQFYLLSAVPVYMPTDGIVISRNEAGILWLRSAGPNARESIVEKFGGDPGSDRDVLLAASKLIGSLSHARLTELDAS